MYISGAYWISKKIISEKYPQNEDLLWGNSDDVEWSLRARNDKFFIFPSPENPLPLREWDEW